MARRYEVTDTQWEIIKPYLGNTPKKTGRPQSDNRKILNGILWILHTGAPWRDLPEYYGPWQTVYKRFSQWQKDDKLRKLFENVRSHPDMQDLCIDGTYIKAHRASAGAKKGAPGDDYHQHIGISRGGRSTKIHAVVDGLGYPLVLELTGGQVNDGLMLQKCLNSLSFPEVLFWLIKPMVHGETENILLIMMLIFAFRQRQMLLIHGIVIIHTIRKGILSSAFL